MKSGIYKITNKVNGKFYIGSAVNIKDRWDKHRSELYRGVHKNPYFLAAWKKYGEKNFSFSVLEYVEDKKNLLMREQHWINWFDACKNGYNINPNATAGGNNKLDLPEALIKLMGAMPDYKLAASFGYNKHVIARRRKSLGIPSFAVQTGNDGKAKEGQPRPIWSNSRREMMFKWREESVADKGSPYMVGLKRSGKIRKFKKNCFDICTPAKENKYASLIKKCQ